VVVEAVIFDWGGTLTPWHTVNHEELWQAVCALHLEPGEAIAAAASILAAEQELWLLAEREHRSATMTQVLAQAGVTATPEFLASYYRAWEPHTFTDPDAAGVLGTLRGWGIKVGVLSNTMWPRSWHEDVFRRDGVLGLIDGAIYSSEIDWTKPHPDAFRAAMQAVGVSDPAHCVFIGDRPFDDVHGAKSIGMRAVLIPHSSVPSYDGAKPDAVIERLAELLPLIEAWQRSGPR
jgi:putative hydrolase of the HAD superfamily